MTKKEIPDINVLVRDYSGRIYGLALRLTQNQEDAEDVLQETFLTVIRKLDTFEGRSAIYTWIHRIATNIALTKLRRLKGAPEVDIAPEDFEALAAGRPGGDSPFLHDLEDTEFLRTAMNRAIAQVPEPLRVVFILRDVEGLTTQETADLLNITPANVKVRLMRARIKMRNLLSHLHPLKGGQA
ncbi:MAG: sigma-70 family RNA polymerase sigma factor [Candidatus Neomarinimicrobiota bacterium]